MKKKIGDMITVRPDSIVEARYSLTPKQNDLIDIFLTEIDSEDNNTYNYILEISKYKTLFPNEGSGNIYRNLKSAVESFEGKGFRISNSDETKAIYFPWFSKIEYNDGSGQIILEIGQSFKKILIEMKRAIYYKPQYSLSLENMYAKRIYYMLKQYEDTGYRYDELNVLREKLECPPSYNRYFSFKSKVLDPAKEQINKSTDIIIDYEEIYKKNKVVRIKFNIKKKKLIEGEELLTSLLLKNTEIKEIETFIKNDLGEYGSEAEKYIYWSIEKINPENIKSNKKAYLKKVLCNDENKEEFIKHLTETNRKIASREKNEKLLRDTEKQLLQEMDDSRNTLMKEYNVQTPEELNEILANKFKYKTS